MRPEISKVFGDPRYLLALGFGSGLSPRAPGTAGSVVAAVLFLGIVQLGLFAYVGLVLATLIGGIFICDYVARDMGAKDPSAVVLDEFVGLWIALICLPEGWYWLPIGFVLFRLFDIAKPWPVGWLDRNLDGGLGIMLDDVAAGVYALGALQLSAYVVSRWMG